MKPGYYWATNKHLVREVIELATEDFERLTKNRDDLLVLLREISDDHKNYCPSCFWNRPDHRPDCRLAAALKGVGA